MSTISDLLRYVRHDKVAQVTGSNRSSRLESHPGVDAQMPVSSRPRQQTSQDGRSAVTGDRRKICRRIQQLPVLVEIRAVTCRRRCHLRADDPLVHVSIKA